MTDSATSRGDDAGTGAAEDTAPAPATVDPEPMEDQAFQLRAAPPVRALAIASAAAIAGAVVIALSGHPATTAVGAVDPGRHHSDQHLAVIGHRVRRLTEGEHVGPAGSAPRHRLHDRQRATPGSARVVLPRARPAQPIAGPGPARSHSGLVQPP